MKDKSMLISVGITVALAVLVTGAAISAQDKYTLKVPRTTRVNMSATQKGEIDP